MQRSDEDKAIVLVLCGLIQRAYGLKDKDLSPEKLERALGGKPELEIAIQSIKLLMRKIIREVPKLPSLRVYVWPSASKPDQLSGEPK